MSVAGKTIIIGGTVAIAVIARAAFPLDGLTPIARREIPSHMVGVYKSAATRCNGLPWQVLAAIGSVSSQHGGGNVNSETGDVATPIIGPALDGADGSAPMADKGQPDGWVHPLGPMGMLPGAWERFAVLAPDRPAGAPPSVQNIWDATYATANELCDNAPMIADLNLAIRRHNPRPLDVMQILLKSARYGSGAVPDVDALVAAVSVGQAGDGSAGVAVVRAALQALGTPYVWGAESPADGFDCSGLVWWAYRQAGFSVARTTDGQVKTGVSIEAGELRPGDLLFTRGGQQVHDLGHVAIYAGGGLEVVAPRSGKSVTVQKVNFDRIQAVRRILA